MAINRKNLVWVGRRIGSPNQHASRTGGWWQMPQGGIDEGEEPAAAALRELAEETGMRSTEIIAESREWHSYDLPRDLLGRAWGGKFRGQKQRWFLARFTGPESEIDIFPADHEAEFDTWRWASLDELIDLIVPFKRDVYSKVVDEFREYIPS
jgi:putative (di)nucleoside polyphosphate hydrolase